MSLEQPNVPSKIDLVNRYDDMMAVRNELAAKISEIVEVQRRVKEFAHSRIEHTKEIREMEAAVSGMIHKIATFFSKPRQTDAGKIHEAIEVLQLKIVDAGAQEFIHENYLLALKMKLDEIFNRLTAAITALHANDNAPIWPSNTSN